MMMSYARNMWFPNGDTATAATTKFHGLGRIDDAATELFRAASDC